MAEALWGERALLPGLRVGHFTDREALTGCTVVLVEEGAVAVIGSTITPNSLAMIDVVAEAKTPMISLAASKDIIYPVDAKRFWVFKTPQTEELMARAIVADMAARGVKTVGYIGFNDAHRGGWARAF